jgi:hypothetical protein
MLFPAKIFAQGNLNISLVPKTYVGNYHTGCYGSNNGEIEILISGGTAPYSVLWNNSSTANPLLNIGAGTYSVIVTDANNASVADTITLIQPPALGFSLEVSQFGEYNLAYYGSTLGHIKINGTGGTPSYSVLWNDNNAKLIRDSLAAGTYSFVLTDANACTLSGSKTLSQPAVLAGTASQIHGASCFGGEDGKAEAVVTGGISPYRYLWDNGSFSSAPEDLSPGLHEVHITDDAYNTLSLQVNISQAPELDAQIAKSNYPNNFNVSCYNCFNGTLDATVSGGTAPYTYEWIWQDNSIGTTSNLSNLGGGNYELIVSDQNNCRLRTETELKEPERQDWSMTGNAGTDPATQFIGTTDSVDVVFKANNSEQLRLGQNSIKITSGNLEIGNNLGVYSRVDSAGTKVLLFRGPEPGQGIPPILTPLNRYCGQSSSQYNVFTGFIYGVTGNYAQPQLAMGADGNGALIDVTGGQQATPGVVPPRLLLNTFCGNDVLVGKATKGALIANYKLGVKTSTPLADFHVEGESFLNGNLGIGQQNPTSELHILGNVPEIKIEDNNLLPSQLYTTGRLQSGNNAFRLLSNGSMIVFLDDDDNESDPMQESFRIMKDGSSDGGNAKDLLLLTGEGLMYIQGIFIKTPNQFNRYPDYVFEKDYPLLSLDSLSAFITKEKHLPGIPSQKEVNEKHGYQLNDLTLELLRKQEEMTLYILDLNKKILALEKQLSNQNNTTQK